MYIAEITERLLEVNRFLLKYIKDTELTFEENLVFSGFYHDYKDINSIINSAEKELNDSPAILMEQAKALSAAASDFLATYESHEDIFYCICRFTTMETVFSNECPHGLSQS